MKDERIAFEKFLDIFDQVVTKMGSLHSPAQDFGTGVPLYRAEIHTIRAIGEIPGINVTRLAEKMRVTKGAVSQTIAKLVRKGLVRKTYAEDDAKEVHLELTNLGRIGFHRHRQFHMEIFDTVREYFGDGFRTKLEIFTTAMTDIKRIMVKYEERKKES